MGSPAPKPSCSPPSPSKTAQWLLWDIFNLLCSISAGVITDIYNFITTGSVSTKDNGPAWTSSFGIAGVRFTSADQSGAKASVTDSPTTGQKLVITDLVISVDTAMTVNVYEQSKTDPLFTLYLPGPGAVQVTPRSKLKLSTADKALQVQTNVAGNIAVTAGYYSEA